jgi:isoleucyl-tRNA synthetase
MRRVPEVIDTWFDSGAMPYAQWHYPFEHRDEFQRHFPADFICEGVDQTRGWFYSLLAIGATVFDQAPFRAVVVNELVLDAQGQKMSKSRGNVVDPAAAVEEFGADTVRLYLLAASQVWLPKPFDRAAIPDAAGGFLNTLRHTYEFLARYAETRPGPVEPARASRLDRWILSRLSATVRAVTDAWSGYDATAGVRAIMDFVDADLSNWYVRRSKPRFWAPDREPDPAAVATLHECLVVVARLLAPAAPFASDWLHRALTDQSVHLARFPTAASAREAPALERGMDAIRRLSSLGRSAREGGGLRVRQTLGRMRVAVPAGTDGPEFRELLDVLADEVNVRQIEVVSSDAELVRLRGRPNFRSLGKRFGKRTPRVAEAVAALPAEPLRALERGSPAALELDGEVLEILPEDLTIEREVSTTWLVQSEGAFVAAVDPTLTDELRRDGLAREVVHRVQRLRKDAGFEYTTRIALAVGGDERLLEAVRAHAAFIEGETLARSLLVGRTLDAWDARDDTPIDDFNVTLAVARWPNGRSVTQ